MQCNKNINIVTVRFNNERNSIHFRLEITAEIRTIAGFFNNKLGMSASQKTEMYTLYTLEGVTA